MTTKLEKTLKRELKIKGKAYVLAKDLVSGLEIGETSLHLTDPRGFDAAKMDAVTIEAGGKSKTVIRIETDQDGTKRKSWADSETKTPNTLVANFVDGVGNLVWTFGPGPYRLAVNRNT